MFELYFENWQGRELIETYATYEEAMKDIEENNFAGDWDYTDGEEGYTLKYPNGEEEAL